MALFDMGRRYAAALGIGWMALAGSGMAQAQDTANWPTKPIELLVLNAPGGASDRARSNAADRWPRIPARSGSTPGSSGLRP